MSRLSSAKIWNYFEKLDDGSKLAICHYCTKTLSYKTTITNLKVHLKQKHILVYNDLLKTSESPTELSALLNNDDSNQSTPSPDVWSFFEKETGGRARCVVCRATLPHRARDLKMHLKEKHPKLAQDCDETSENEDDQNDTYTEVVYLEDETRKPHKRDQSRIRQSFKPHPPLKKVKKRKSSSSSDEFLDTKLDDNDDQIEKFGTYITCLLKKVPKDVSIKLQMDIINLIMTTKLKTSSENKVIIDGVPVAIQAVNAVPGTGFIVTVPSSSDCGKQNVTVAEAKCDPLTHESRDLPKLSIGNTVSQDMSIHNC